MRLSNGDRWIHTTSSEGDTRWGTLRTALSRTSERSDARAIIINYDELHGFDVAKLPKDVQAVMVRPAPQTEWATWTFLRDTKGFEETPHYYVKRPIEGEIT